ncbi:ferredoxin [[Mycobacterium] wendilense]|nr:ferredoxin [Mycolicibacterium sp. MU0050]
MNHVLKPPMCTAVVSIGVWPMAKVHIDSAKCSGHARCFAAAPGLFDLDDSGYVIGPCVDVPPGAEADAETAVESCPERALTLE